MKNNLLDTTKIFIENFFYTFGFKINFKRKKLQELEPTTDLKTQFKNLSVIKEWLEKDHAENIKSIDSGLYQKMGLSTRINRELVNPELILINPHTTAKHQTYALIWTGSKKIVKIFYIETGRLTSSVEEFTSNNQTNMTGYGAGVSIARDYIGRLNQ